MQEKEPSCGNCMYYQPIPFAMISICENKVSELYHCDCHPREDVCFYYEPKERIK